MYHSPGLRDGVSSQGTRVRPYPPELLGAESAIARFSFAGNKLGRSRVITVDWDFQQIVLESERARPSQALFEFLGARNFRNWLNHLHSHAV
jgi:hypothetical protein